MENEALYVVNLFRVCITVILFGYDLTYLTIYHCSPIHRSSIANMNTKWLMQALTIKLVNYICCGIDFIKSMTRNDSSKCSISLLFERLVFKSSSIFFIR